MEREQILHELNGAIENLTRLHVRYGLHNTDGFRVQKERVSHLVREHGVDVRRELLPEVSLLYRRYFE